MLRPQSPRDGSTAAGVVGALTDELLRALRDECESDVRSGWTVVFRGVLDRLVALNDALSVSGGGGSEVEIDGGGGGQEGVRQRLLQVVASIRSAAQSERSIARSAGTVPGECHVKALATTHGVGGGDDRDDCDALRMLVLAPLRAAFARELHERVTSIACGLYHSRDTDGKPFLSEDDVPSEDNSPADPSEEPHLEDDEDAVSAAIEWGHQWKDDCRAQLCYFHTLLDGLDDQHTGSDDDGDDDDNCVCSDGSGGCSSESDDDDSELSDGVCSPTASVISRVLEDHQMGDEHQDLLERALAVVAEGKRARRMLASAREKSRWRRIAAHLDGATWRSIYDPDSCSDNSKLALLPALGVQFKLANQSSMRSCASTESGDHSSWRSDKGDGIARRPPKWLIPVSEITLNGSAKDKSQHSRGASGRWLDADVLFKPIRRDRWADIAERTAKTSPLVGDIEQCYRLSHPNVAKLFGVCYDGEQYFCVCEYEEWSSLSDFARFADDKEVWQVLYEAALGLQFLHASGVSHGNLRPSSIVVGSDGLANIDMIGTRTAIMENSMLIDHCFEYDKAQWVAPECLRGASGSFESDVYSLGMLIVGEFNGCDKPPWGNEVYSTHIMHRVAKMGDLPPRPEALDDVEWALVVQMCAFNSSQRPSISSVVSCISAIIETPNETSDEEADGPSKREVWERILAAAKALEHLHDELHICIGVIASLEMIHPSDHGDPLASTEAALESARAGHLSRRWVAPETISAGTDAGDADHEVAERDLCEACASASFAADVYSLGILIVEAVTRDYAWGSRTLDVVAGEAKLQGRLPPQPPAFSEQQWHLVERMCARDAGSRLSVSEVVDELRQFAYDKSAQLAESSESSISSISDLEESNVDENWIEEDAGSGEEETPGVAAAGNDVAELLVPMLGLPVTAVLQNMRTLLEADSNISIEANWYVLRRLESIYDLARLSAEALMDESELSKHMALEALNQYCAALLRFWHFLNESAHVDLIPTSGKRLARELDRPLISSGSCVRNNFVFHRLLDSVMRTLTDARSLSSTAVSVHDWRAKWFRTRNSQLRIFADRLSIDSSIEEESSDANGTSSGNDADEDDCADSESAGGSSTLNNIAGGQETREQALSGGLPSWFIPAYDVVFDELHLLGSGSFGSVHKATWLGAPVVVKKITSAFESNTQRALFDREVSIWYRLHHPHIVKLFGACHVGQPFFVCEHALFGRLDRYLAHRARQQQHDGSFSRVGLAWKKIYEASLGLQYLHERGVIHADLKCDNILVAMDGKAKLSDFGLSSIARTRQRQRFQREVNESDAMCLGAIRWKAPEILAGGSPTRASDVYGMGMCLIEAVTGTYPWGNSIPDVAVAFHVKRGRLPRRPQSFSCAEWQLVEAMCCFDPDERLRIGEVVKALAARVELAQLRSTNLM